MKLERITMNANVNEVMKIGWSTPYLLRDKKTTAANRRAVVHTTGKSIAQHQDKTVIT